MYVVSQKNVMKLFLFILVAFVALTATFSGLIIISNPADGGMIHLQQDMLANTPFKSFLVPGIILTVLVGGVNMVAVALNIRRHPGRYNWAMAGGVMITGWIVVQMILLNAFSWLQLVYLGAGLLIILTAYQLKGKWAA
jgi:hypothetical protein